MKCNNCGGENVQELRMPCNLVVLENGEPQRVYVGTRYGCPDCFDRTLVNSGKLRLAKSWADFNSQYQALRNNECCYELHADGSIGRRL
jgi:hypothetical protein